MTGMWVRQARTTDCPAPTHSIWARQRLGCICPLRETDQANARQRSRTLTTGPRRVPIHRDSQPDMVTVDRLLSGNTTVFTTVADRQAAVAALTARGESIAQIAAWLRCNPRTVVRYRARAAAGGVR